MVGAVLNVFLNAWLIPKLGFVAAGYTTLLCYILYALAHFYFMKKVCDEHLGRSKVYDAKVILSIGVGLLTVSVVIMALYNTVIIRYALLLCLSVFAVTKRRIFVGLFKNLKGR